MPSRSESLFFDWWVVIDSVSSSSIIPSPRPKLKDIGIVESSSKSGLDAESISFNSEYLISLATGLRGVVSISKLIGVCGSDSKEEEGGLEDDSVGVVRPEYVLVVVADGAEDDDEKEKIRCKFILEKRRLGAVVKVDRAGEGARTEGSSDPPYIEERRDESRSEEKGPLW